MTKTCQKMNFQVMVNQFPKLFLVRAWYLMLLFISQTQRSKIWLDLSRIFFLVSAQDFMEDEKIVKKETTDWGSWGACDATCGFGIRSRSRIVDDVPISDQDRCYQQECMFLKCMFYFMIS